ncbi:MAG: hypothetical protein ABFE13_26000, partial [Phycisphaerales bacterium]
MLKRKTLATLVLTIGLTLASAGLGAQDDRAAQLAEEVGGKGWIAFAARAENGTWDLFLMRP